MHRKIPAHACLFHGMENCNCAFAQSGRDDVKKELFFLLVTKPSLVTEIWI
jgi:hypothetical protein